MDGEVGGPEVVGSPEVIFGVVEGPEDTCGVDRGPGDLSGENADRSGGPGPFSSPMSSNKNQKFQKPRINFKKISLNWSQFRHDNCDEGETQ